MRIAQIVSLSVVALVMACSAQQVAKSASTPSVETVVATENIPAPNGEVKETDMPAVVKQRLQTAVEKCVEEAKKRFLSAKEEKWCWEEADAIVCQLDGTQRPNVASPTYWDVHHRVDGGGLLAVEMNWHQRRMLQSLQK